MYALDEEVVEAYYIIFHNRLKTSKEPLNF